MKSKQAVFEALLEEWYKQQIAEAMDWGEPLGPVRRERDKWVELYATAGAPNVELPVVLTPDNQEYIKQLAEGLDKKL